MSKFLKYPEEVQKIFLFEQKRQTGKEDIQVFLKDHASSISSGGFSWFVTLYNQNCGDNNRFRNTVSLRNKTPNNYDEIIEFYRREVPGIFQPETKAIKIDGKTFVI